MAEKVCDAYCTNCIYYLGSDGKRGFCNYYLITDNRRPCDPGKGCTVLVLREKNRRTRKDREQGKCKLCYPEKQIGKEPTPGWYCKVHKSYRRQDDFCSYGERREGE